MSEVAEVQCRDLLDGPGPSTDVFYQTLFAPDEPGTPLQELSPRACVIRNAFGEPNQMLQVTEECADQQNGVVTDLFAVTPDELRRYGFGILTITTNPPFRTTYSNSHTDMPSVRTESVPPRIRFWRGERVTSLIVRSEVIPKNVYRDLKALSWTASITPTDLVAFVSQSELPQLPVCRHSFERPKDRGDNICHTSVILSEVAA